MKILVINNGYTSTAPSGGDKHLLEIAQAWAASHTVMYVLPDYMAKLLDARIRAFPYSSYAPKGLMQLLWVYLQRTRKALRVMPDLGAEVVFCSPGLFDVLPALAHKRQHHSKVATYVFHIGRGVQESKRLSSRLQALLSRLAQAIALRYVRRVDFVFTSNNIVRTELMACGISADRIVVQTPAINKAGVHTAVACPAPDVLFAGRLVAKKGVQDLLIAMQTVKATCGIIGDGEERQALERTAKALGVENRVEFFGAVSEEKLYGLLKGCRCFAFPSYEEGYGIAIAEAILAQRPVVAYALPHYKEVFNDALTVVPLGDIQALAKAITNVLEADVDQSRLQERYKDVKIWSANEAAEFELNAATGRV